MTLDPRPKLRRRTMLAGLGACLLPMATHAQDAYPHRLVNVIVPYGAGGGTDILARVIADELTTRMGQKFLVENVAGAGGVIGTQKVMSSPADGYQLLVGSGSELELMQITDPTVQLGNWKPLAPVALVGTQPMVLVGRTSLPFSTADELVAYAKSHPGALSYASAGVGTQLHLLGELLKASAGIDMTHVPYKAAGQIATDVVGGHTDLAVMVLPSALPHIRSGKMKVFGVSETRRSPAAPDITTLAESAPFKGVDMAIWYGVFAPGGTPAAIVDRLGKEIGAAAHAPAVQAKLIPLAVAVADDNSAANLERMKREGLAKLRRLYEASQKK
ncbi:MAG TPA: tripartite tricarboxylate transporter substrate binding protein [Ramlibacter sp.]|uniref:Bug family tripartite tricarboxylate transporter substrate binding protein n=1 Tax=Ramlibacter sp. TaxID=1917967 RepID=UPI002C31C290|nr:tripartite tricarboxylate transporter substrate binding protein [Ramlibacter sp.]HVZ42638.1 tripartite tricarboxylate transporter substrate binding protein [Ramlibacter sp.]